MNRLIEFLTIVGAVLFGTYLGIVFPDMFQLIKFIAIIILCFALNPIAWIVLACMKYVFSK